MPALLKLSVSRISTGQQVLIIHHLTVASLGPQLLEDSNSQRKQIKNSYVYCKNINHAMRMLSTVQMKRSFKNHFQKCLTEPLSSVYIASSHQLPSRIVNFQLI